MAQDPAFLLYYKDILVSCADWDGDELGWYVRLICHQADKQKGLIFSMEDLASLAGVKYSQYPRFLQVWENRIKHKFELTEDNLLVNIKQAKTLEERKKFKEDQGEKGLFGYYMKIAKREILASNLAWETLEPAIRKYLHENISKTLSKEQNQANWKQTLEKIKTNPSSWASSTKGDGIGDGDGNGIGDGNNNIKDRGVGKGNLLCPEMLRTFKKNIPLYGEDLNRDYQPLLSIGSYLFEYFKMQGEFLSNQQKIIDEWDKVSKWISKDSFYCQKSLASISNHIQEIVNKSQNGTIKKEINGKHTSVASKQEAGFATALARGKQKFAAAGNQNIGT